MDSDLPLSLVVLLLLLLVMAAASAADAAWPRMNRTRLRHMSGEGVTRAGVLLSLADKHGASGATLTVANAASISLFAAIGVSTALQLSGDNQLSFYVAAALGGFLVLWVELTGHAVGHLYPDSTLFALVWPIRAMQVLLTPLTTPLRRLARLVVPADPTRLLNGNSTTDEELRMIVDAVEEDGALEQEEKEMIHSIFEMGEKTAREIMVPRVDVAAVEASESLGRVLELINERGHSRIPIFEETIDNIEGVVYAKDLLSYMVEGSLGAPARSLARLPLYIPESKKTDDLLREMQKNKIHLAVVLDEYGGTSGIVTIEDLLEEIVGEIQDEHDAEEAAIEKLNDHEAVFDARVSIRDMKETLDISLEVEEFDTVGGLVYDRLGKIPVVGDEVKVDGLWLTVLSTKGKRIKKVKIRVEQDTAEEHSLSGL